MVATVHLHYAAFLRQVKVDYVEAHHLTTAVPDVKGVLKQEADVAPAESLLHPALGIRWVLGQLVGIASGHCRDISSDRPVTHHSGPLPRRAAILLNPALPPETTPSHKPVIFRSLF